MSLRKVLGGSARRGIVVTVIAVLALAVAGLADREVLTSNRPHSQAERRVAKPSVSKMFDYQATLLVVGDSYATTYPSLVASKMDWNLAQDVRDGTGFVGGADNASTRRVPFIDRLGPDAATYHVDYVLVDGGRSDLGEPPEAVEMAAETYVKKVHSKWPKAKVVMVLPTVADPGVAPKYADVAHAVRRAAESARAGVIDPVLQGWFRDVDAKSLLARDGIHLNENGYTYYGGKIVDNLRQMFDNKPTMLVVGDSYPGGTGDPRFVTYPFLVSRKMGWNVFLDAQGNTGFVHGFDKVSPPRVPFIDRLGRDVATYHVNYVLIDGGRSDLGDPPEVVVAAAGRYIKDVHSAWPNAKIIVVLPALAMPDVAPNYAAVAEGIRRVAESVGAHVIDPVEQGWFRDSGAKALLWRDGFDLNGDGNIYYADKIIENLKRMGFGS